MEKSRKVLEKHDGGSVMACACLLVYLLMMHLLIGLAG